MKKRIYLDYSATTPCDSVVVKAMLPYFSDKFGNASTLYSFGKEARAAIEQSREKVANAIGANTEEIVFTSSGTESNNTVLKGIAYINEDKGDHIITTSIEHHSVVEPCKFLEKQGFKLTYLPVDKYGLVDPEDIKKAITPKTLLVSIIYGNNEIGTIQPIKEIGKIVKESGIYFHTDAVQALGHIPVNVNISGIDFLSASAHKFYGPKGIGILYIRRGSKITPLMHGGDQEKKKRASTENVPAIVGLGIAVEIAIKSMDDEMNRIKVLRDKFVSGVLNNIENVKLNGHPTDRLPNNVNFSIKGIEGEAIILRLDMEGISASTGSACSSYRLEPSHVLLAIGVQRDLAQGSIRFSLGKYTKDKDIDYVLKVLPDVVAKLRSISPLY